MCPGSSIEVYLCMLAHMCILTWLGISFGAYLCPFIRMYAQTGASVCSCICSFKSRFTLFFAYCTLHVAGMVTDAYICASVRIFMRMYALRYRYGAGVHVHGELLGVLAWRPF